MVYPQVMINLPRLQQWRWRLIMNATRPSLLRKCATGSKPPFAHTNAVDREPVLILCLNTFSLFLQMLCKLNGISISPLPQNRLEKRSLRSFEGLEGHIRS